MEIALGFEKQSDGNAMWVLSPNQPFSPKVAKGAGGAFALYIRGYTPALRPTTPTTSA